ncbi:HD-GYP domain-containing protein [Halalkalibacter alkalisediminis]|uniref:HD-GYP domain-containing protein n=1 Tax=Halalkalibacter alkalisediminis TaxID=935616 RepID=A0ABV6NKJ9_9BACI|nr:HD-GYP domain-containing protein [Halalkalibacter alkalisediminis]
MKVKPAQLQRGCITTKDVEGLTDFPIIKENTVLTDELIDILKLFLVDMVEVESVLANGETFKPLEVIEEIEEIEIENNKEKQNEFLYQYVEAVKQFKKLFQSWQAGRKVEMLEVRTIFIPLFERVMEQPKKLLQLHHYSNKEDYNYHHSVYVGILSAYIGYKMKLNKGDWLQIGFGGVLADLGMTKVSPSILKKKGSLTSVEFEEVKKHPIHSYKMLKGITGVSDLILLAVLQHHERYDGSGYPLGVNSKKIHLFSQIVAISDVYHAMTTERLYRSKRFPYQVLEDITKEQFGKFDVKVVQALLQSLVQISIGDKVRLSSGDDAEIVFIDQQIPTRPMVKLLNSEEIIELNHHPSIFIEEII